MIDNQRGRRNLSKEQLLDLGMKRAALLEDKAREKIEASHFNGKNEAGEPVRVSAFQKSETPKINTTKEIADYAGVSIDTASKYKKVIKYSKLYKQRPCF